MTALTPRNVSDQGGVRRFIQTENAPFFINGHRHRGQNDLEALTAALRRELQAAGQGPTRRRPSGS